MMSPNFLIPWLFSDANNLDTVVFIMTDIIITMGIMKIPLRIKEKKYLKTTDKDKSVR